MPLYPAPFVPHTSVVRLDAASGGTSSTTYVDLPAAVAVANFVKYLAATKLIVEAFGQIFMDDASAVAKVCVDVNGTDTEIVEIWGAPSANNENGFGGAVELTGLAAGVYSSIKLQWAVGAGTVAANQNGSWCIKVTETY